ncbi:MAG: hypothetical protein K6A89_01825 [Treponema sp.]|nr:hypothetical protein [Treponema sp.]
MAVENLFETRLEKRYKSLYDKSNDKYGYTGLYKYVLVDADDNLLFYASTKYDACFYYFYLCKNNKEDIDEVCEKIKNITEDSECYNQAFLRFPELLGFNDFKSFYKLQGEQYYSYSILNKELDSIQKKINLLNSDNALEKSLEAALKDMNYHFDPYNNPKADDEIYEIRKKLKKIDFLEDMDFLILSENEKIRKLYKGYLSGLESFQVDFMSYSR